MTELSPELKFLSQNGLSAKETFPENGEKISASKISLKKRSSKKTEGITACIITLNEEHRLPACLDSLDFVDEIIVVDSGSVDRTRKIARQYGAHVYQRKFTGFVQQKNYAVSLASRDWILVVDADEVVTPGLREEILSVRNQGTLRAFRLPRMSYYLGRWIRHSGWYPDYNVRFFRKNYAIFVGGTVHERAKAEGPVGTFKNHLEHFSYRNISDHLIRIERYSTLIAQDKYRRGKSSSITWAIGKSISKFFLTYIYRFGFLDGQAGIVIAVLAGYYNFLKYAKLWELNTGRRKLEE